MYSYALNSFLRDRNDGTFGILFLGYGVVGERSDRYVTVCDYVGKWNYLLVRITLILSSTLKLNECTLTVNEPTCTLVYPDKHYTMSINENILLVCMCKVCINENKYKIIFIND